MTHLPSGTVNLIDLPGSGSLMSRTIAIYKKLLPQMLTISVFLMLTGVINLTLNSFFQYLVKDNAHIMKAIMEVVGGGISVVAAGFYSLFFAAGVITVKEFANGKTLTASEAITQAKKVYLSVFWVGLLVALVGYAGSLLAYWGLTSAVAGASLAVVVPALFAVWYYFAAYIIVTEEVRGIAALAKSHYLTRGLWWKVMGRAVMLYLVYALVALVAFFMLAIPSVGWLLCGITIATLVLFAFPFQLIYDLVRFEDLVAVQRSREFLYYKGERTLIKFWAVIGAIFIATSWSFNLLSCDAKANAGQKLAEGAIAVLLKVAPAINENTTTLYNFINKIMYSYPSCQAPVTTTTTAPTTQYQDLPIEPSLEDIDLSPTTPEN